MAKGLSQRVEGQVGLVLPRARVLACQALLDLDGLMAGAFERDQGLERLAGGLGLAA